jgi:GMP synthase-like glutamine amidotransferase
MKFLVIKHVVVEGLGIFEQFCHDAGIVLDAVELEQGASFPDIADYSALWVMGGPMNVGDEGAFPWLADEKALIRKAVRDLQLPYMGICLGAQLLADALGGEVKPMVAPEVGLLTVTVNATGCTHPLLRELPEMLNVFEWHGQEVKCLPEGAILLASSDRCQVQAYAVGAYAFGLQFHSEIIDTTLEDWTQIPAYSADLEAALGSTGSANFKRVLSEHLPVMNREAKILFDNFLKIVRSRWQG